MKELRTAWSVLVFALTLTLLSGVSPAASSSNVKLVLSRSTLNFGNVVVGSSTQVVENIWNPTTAAISIASASVEGTDFKISTNFPLTVAARQQVSVLVTFTAVTSGNAAGSLLISLNGATPYFTVPLYGIGVNPGQLTASPASISFGGASASRITETVTNSGSTNIWLQTATTSGNGFALSAAVLPVLLQPNQSTAFIVTRSSAGNVSGNINLNGMLRWRTAGERGTYQALTSAPASMSLVIPVSGTAAVVAGQLTPAPSTISFGTVQTGNSQNLPATLTNSGAGPVAITGATATGSGFGLSGLPLPMTLSAGESVTFSASFAPQTTGNAQGNISVVSNASNSTVNLALSGSANAPGQLALSPASLNFGNVIVGKSQQLTASLAASGSSVTVSSASFSGSEYSLSGIQLPVTIPAGQSSSFTVTFTPQASGTASASLSFGGTAPAAVESLSGAGSAPPQHNVALSWSADSSSVAGYNVYRGTQTGGPYAKLTSSPAAATTYGDGSVTAGQTYFYVTTAVDSTGAESAHSNEVQAVIPSP
ncbi:MAG: choice-of-anchor D domain-containing protein [Terriglobales bacterium]